jgi:hypothetical protein
MSRKPRYELQGHRPNQTFVYHRRVCVRRICSRSLIGGKSLRVPVREMHTPSVFHSRHSFLSMPLSLIRCFMIHCFLVHSQRLHRRQLSYVLLAFDWLRSSDEKALWFDISRTLFTVSWTALVCDCAIVPAAGTVCRQ